MAKMWINPEFQELYKKTDPSQKDKDKKNFKKFDQKKRKKKVNPAEEYINKKIQDRKMLQFKFIDNEIVKGVIQWADQRYLKIRTIDKEGIVVERKSIKYIRHIPK